MKKVFWGLLFLLVNIRIWNIEVVSEMAGVILIYFGCKEVENLRDEFKYAGEISIICGVIVALRWVIGTNIISDGLFFFPKICMIYMLCKGCEYIYSNCDKVGIIKWYKIYLVVSSMKFISAIFDNRLFIILWMIDCIAIFMILKNIYKGSQVKMYINSTNESV